MRLKKKLKNNKYMKCKHKNTKVICPSWSCICTNCKRIYINNEWKTRYETIELIRFYLEINFNNWLAKYL